MGFDISYHPISEEEMKKWYFNCLKDFSAGNEKGIYQLASEYEIEDFYVEKYKETLAVAIQTTKEEYFDKSHGYYIAVIQGFFRTYFYTRGTAFSFLIEDKPNLQIYVKPWQETLTDFFENPIANKIIENYCSGVFIPYSHIEKLYSDYQSNDQIKKDLDEFFEENIDVFMKAINYCRENKLGLLEATEVIEPNPIALNDSTCYSNLYNCDTDGPLMYQTVAMKQIEEATHGEGKSLEEIIEKASYVKVTPQEEIENVKKGFWKKIFKR